VAVRGGRNREAEAFLGFMTDGKGGEVKVEVM
jgi:hypothetical protein